MSAAMPDANTVALRLHEQADALIPNPAQFLDQAREELIDRLISGKRVYGITSRAIFDCAVDGSYHDVLDLLDSILAMNDKFGDERFLLASECADKAKKIIEDFVDSKPDWIEEQAAQIAFDEGEDHG